MMTAALRRATGRHSARQHGVATREELLELCWTDAMIDWALATGVIHRLFPGVYRLFGAADSWPARALAAQRRVDRQLRRKLPEGASIPLVALTGSAAARLHELPWFSRSTRLVVATSRRCRSSLVETVTHPSLSPADVTEVDGIPVTTLAWTVIVLASSATVAHVRDLIVYLDGRGLLSSDELAATALRAEGLPGRHVVLLVLEGLSGRFRSKAERRLAEACIEAGLPPPGSNVTVVTSSGRAFELDLYWESVGLDVEVDGPHHLLSDQRGRDRVRDRILRDDGIRVTRVFVEDVDHDVDEVANRVARRYRELAS